MSFGTVSFGTPKFKARKNLNPIWNELYPSPSGAYGPRMYFDAPPYSCRHDGDVPDFSDSGPICVMDALCGLCALCGLRARGKMDRS
ncbi:MAG: hypothetical protein ACI8R4_000212 [Paracoccaceae bacterium]|jgi:hypothetical protein